MPERFNLPEDFPPSRTEWQAISEQLILDVEMVSPSEKREVFAVVNKWLDDFFEQYSHLAAIPKAEIQQTLETSLLVGLQELNHFMSVFFNFQHVWEENFGGTNLEIITSDHVTQTLHKYVLLVASIDSHFSTSTKINPNSGQHGEPLLLRDFFDENDDQINQEIIVIFLEILLFHEALHSLLTIKMDASVELVEALNDYYLFEIINSAKNSNHFWLEFPSSEQKFKELVAKFGLAADTHSISLDNVIHVYQNEAGSWQLVINVQNLLRNLSILTNWQKETSLWVNMQHSLSDLVMM